MPLCKPIVLDCTLRDGGYYTKWLYSELLVDSYLNAMSACEIDFVELGLRSCMNSGFKGPFAYCKDKFLDKLSIPKGLKVSVMINSSEIIEKKLPEEKTALYKTLFPIPKRHSKIDLVRIACKAPHTKYIKWFVEQLIDDGYSVGINLMQISELSNDEIVEVVNTVNQYNILVLYIADSLGVLDGIGIKKIIDTIAGICLFPIGIHAHDNTGSALSNSIMASNHGVKWIDATVLGMGRGPGNTRLVLSINTLY